MVFLISQMKSEETPSLQSLLVMGMVFLVGGPLVYWSAHKERRAAEPLVRFLHNTLKPGGASFSKSDRPRLLNAVTLSVNGESTSAPLSLDMIQDALLRTGTHDVVIVEKGPEHYLQTIGRDGGYVVELRQGSAAQHFMGKRRGTSPEWHDGDALTFDEAVAVFAAYGTGDPKPAVVSWEPLDLAS